MVVHIAGMARQVPLPNADSFPFEEAVSIQDQQNQTITTIAVTPATESANASLA